MRVSYKGMDNSYPYRVAEISFNENEQEKINSVIDLLEKDGWIIDTVTDGYYLCQVEDRAEYNDFVRDWKKAKMVIVKGGKTVC